MIIITGGIALRPEHRSEGLALSIAHSQRSRTEPGCIAHNCHSDAEDPDRIVFVEEWTDMDAVKAHFAVPDSGAFVQALALLADNPPTMRIFTVQQQRN